MQPLPPRLTIKQTALRLGVSRFTVYRLIQKGVLRPVWLTDTKYAVLLASVERYEARRDVQNARAQQAPDPPWKADRWAQPVLRGHA